jgi:hypothetical protein
MKVPNSEYIRKQVDTELFSDNEHNAAFKYPKV